MILEKVFEVTLNITNPINFCTNKKSHILTELSNIYVNKCYLGSYILEILEILQSSSCRIVNTNSSGNGIIDVKFLANVYILNSWDILIGVEVEKNQSLIVGNYKKSNLIIDVTFKPTNIQANSLTVGQLVPIRVVKAMHKSKESKIAVAAVLLTCDRKIIHYRVKGEISKTHLPEIQMLFDNISEELNHRSIIKKESLLFFESLVYSYKTISKIFEKIQCGQENWEGPKHNVTGNIINIFDTLSTDLTGFWSRPLGICRSSPLLVLTQEKPSEYVLTAPHLMIIEFAKNILTFLIAIREFNEVYTTPEQLVQHENIWNMMRHSQISN